MQAFLYVFIGGGLGSIVRYGIAVLMKKNEWDYPIATLTANAISCIILGVLIALSLKGNMQEWSKLLFITGFCGGFSTFSTFSFENFQLLQEGNYGMAMLYISASLLICLLCIFLGMKIVG